MNRPALIVSGCVMSALVLLASVPTLSGTFDGIASRSIGSLPGAPQPVNGESCCLPGGACFPTDPGTCNAIGGVGGGPGSTCMGDLDGDGFDEACEPHSCCLPGGACADLDPATCVAVAGKPGITPLCAGDLNGDGFDESCQPHSCCLPGGACADLDPATCNAAGGKQGLTPSCIGDLDGDGFDDSCEPQACCLPGGACTMLLDPASCNAAGGKPQGFGSVCPTPPFCHQEACCLPGGFCAMLDPGSCNAAGGKPRGPGTVCFGDLDGDGIDDACRIGPGEPGEVQFYDSPVEFVSVIEATGKALKAFWDFKPHDIGAGVVAIDDPLDILTHDANPADPWTTLDGTGLWPPFVDNVQFSSNMSPQGPLTPRGAIGLAFAGAGFLENTNNVLVANADVDSFDIISGPPAGDNHTAIGLELYSFFGGGSIHVTVYDKEDLELAKTTVGILPGEKVFLGIVRKDRMTIGRVDIWDATAGPEAGFEGISSIALYFNPPPCPWDCADGNGIVDVVDFLGVLAQWGTLGPCDFDGGGVSVTDFLKLLGSWGPCP